MFNPLPRPDLLCRRKAGFTLIEISIVLVIIGLIIGGILIGQDLIRAATIRAQVSQIEKLSTACNAFRIKYGYIPGDLPSVRAATLGFFAETTLGGTVGHQDGNNLIQLAEVVGMWRHLTDAQMIDGNYGTATAGNPLVVTTGWITTTTITGTTQFILPPAKLARGNFVWAEGLTTYNTFRLTLITAIDASGIGNMTIGNGITPIEAQQIDSKLDDGKPSTGKVVGGSYIAGDCVVGSPSNYYLTAPYGESPQCVMTLRTAF